MYVSCIQKEDDMNDPSPGALVQQWQDAANRQNIPRLLELSDAHIELVGPRGVAHGHEILADWVQRAGVHLTTLRMFVRDHRVVVAQHGAWRSRESGTVTGEADVASFFSLHQQRVVRVARYDTLEQALQAAQLTISDEQ